MVAEVIINRTAKKLNRVFDYNIPKNMEDFVIIGSRVLVPFGKSKKLEEAYVIGIKEESQYEVKDIAKLEDSLTNFQIKLAKWMARRYFCNVSDCIRLMQMPGTNSKENKVKDKIINTVYLKKGIEEIEFEIETGKIKSPKHKKIIEFVKSNEGCTIPEIEMFTDCSRAIVNTLIKNNYLEIVEKTIDRDSISINRDKQNMKTGKSISDQVMARALMTPDELRRLDNDMCIIFEKGIKPVKAPKFYYFKHPMAKQMAACEISHNDIGEIERGTWRKYNPYNPYVEEKEENTQENLKVESLDDLFEDIDAPKKEEKNKKSNVMDNNKQDGGINLFDLGNDEEENLTKSVTKEDDEYDLQKELEAKFDELFGPIDD